jgi:hypothetical protein
MGDQTGNVRLHVTALQRHFWCTFCLLALIAHFDSVTVCTMHEKRLGTAILGVELTIIDRSVQYRDGPSKAWSFQASRESRAVASGLCSRSQIRSVRSGDRWRASVPNMQSRRGRACERQAENSRSVGCMGGQARDQALEASAASGSAWACSLLAAHALVRMHALAARGMGRGRCSTAKVPTPRWCEMDIWAWSTSSPFWRWRIHRQGHWRASTPQWRAALELSVAVTW